MIKIPTDEKDNPECLKCYGYNTHGDTWEEHDDQQGGTKVCGDYECFTCGCKWSIGQ